jgi:sugar phosphate isomerase/epimerase
MKDLTFGSDFAKKLGVDKVATHVGFLPENPTSSQYNELVVAIRYVAAHCKANGQKFLFETGQETPVTLRRAIEDIALDNLGINLDTANLIMYGKGNPVDALDVFGEFVLDVHAKDGLYPTDGKKLGREVKVGEGKVNFPALINGLKKIGYDGVLTIEREISGEQQGIDILDTKKYLENLLNEG